MLTRQVLPPLAEILGNFDISRYWMDSSVSSEPTGTLDCRVRITSDSGKRLPNAAISPHPRCREFAFPALSLFDPCSDSSQEHRFPKYSLGGTYRVRVAEEGAIFPVFFPVSRELRQRRVRARLRPPPSSQLSMCQTAQKIGISLCSSDFSGTREFCLIANDRNDRIVPV
jgi:hypothetical protein